MALKHKFTQGTLHYLDVDTNEWTKVDALPTITKGNVAHVAFDHGITIEQRLPMQARACILKLIRGDHYQSVIWSRDKEQEARGTVADFLAEIELNPGHLPSCTLEITDSMTHSLDEFPLHRAVPKMAKLRLRLPHMFNKPKMGAEDVMARLHILTTGEDASLHHVP